MRAERRATRERGKYAQIKAHWTTEEEQKYIEESYAKEEVRGANPCYWEDVNIGDDLTPLVKGPLSVGDMMAWGQGRDS